MHNPKWNRFASFCRWSFSVNATDGCTSSLHSPQSDDAGLGSFDMTVSLVDFHLGLPVCNESKLETLQWTVFEHMPLWLAVISRVCFLHWCTGLFDSEETSCHFLTCRLVAILRRHDNESCDSRCNDQLDCLASFRGHGGCYFAFNNHQRRGLSQTISQITKGIGWNVFSWLTLSFLYITHCHITSPCSSMAVIGVFLRLAGYEVLSLWPDVHMENMENVVFFF